MIVERRVAARGDDLEVLRRGHAAELARGQEYSAHVNLRTFEEAG
jgi:hypothetical protein